MPRKSNPIFNQKRAFRPRKTLDKSRQGNTRKRPKPATEPENKLFYLSPSEIMRAQGVGLTRWQASVLRGIWVYGKERETKMLGSLGRLPLEARREQARRLIEKGIIRESNSSGETVYVFGPNAMVYCKIIWPYLADPGFGKPAQQKLSKKA
jgi:hypothetical protein